MDKINREFKLSIYFSIIAIVFTIFCNLNIVKHNCINRLWYLGNKTLSVFIWFFSEWVILTIALSFIILLMPKNNYGRIIMAMWLWLSWTKLLDEFIKPVYPEIAIYEWIILIAIILITIVRLRILWQIKKKETS